MNRSPVLFGVAAVLAGTTAILGIFGILYNLILLVAAVPFAAATYVVWRHATGRLTRRVRKRTTPFDAARGASEAAAATGREPSGFGRRSRPGPAPPEDGAGFSPRRREAARVLNVEPDAEPETVKQAFRERARELHPDAPDGDAEAFQRVRDAYETLRIGR